MCTKCVAQLSGVIVGYIEAVHNTLPTSIHQYNAQYGLGSTWGHIEDPRTSEPLDWWNELTNKYSAKVMLCQ